MLPLPALEKITMGHDSLPMLTDEALFGACGVRVAFTGREGGVSEGPYASLNTAGHVDDDPARVARNRQIVLEALGVPDAALIVPNQVHGTDVVRVTDVAAVPALAERAAEGADAVIVDVPGVAALLIFADCLSLVIVAPSGRFAVVHAGWRGAVAGIAGIACRQLAQGSAAGTQAAAGSAVRGGEAAVPEPARTWEDPAGFNAYIGPHIGPECFEVSQDVAARFRDAFGEEVLAAPDHVSLAAAVTTDLVAAGMDRARIADASICTVCSHNEYYSYRASGICGRHAAIAVRR